MDLNAEENYSMTKKDEKFRKSFTRRIKERKYQVQLKYR